MWRVAVLAVVAGCAAPRAPSREALREHEREHGKERVDLSAPARADDSALRTPIAIARPDVPGLIAFMPDPERELRWPLSVSAHPSLEPAFAIGPALAEPTIAWTDLCTRGAQNRSGGGSLRDLTTYLRAWCTVEDGNLDAGLDQLVKLTSTVVPKLADAVRLDIISILAAGDADDAERLLAKHQLSNLERLDLLAAVFVELGKPKDAYTINGLALAADRDANHANSCHRLLREIALGPGDMRDAPFDELRALAESQKPAPLCVELYNELLCWAFLNPAPRRGLSTSDRGLEVPHVHPVCTQYWKGTLLTLGEQKVLQRYAQWPSGPAEARTWFDVADDAARGLTIEGADELVAAALEAAVRASRCSSAITTNASTLAQHVRDTPGRKRTVDSARLHRLINAPATLCEP